MANVLNVAYVRQKKFIGDYVLHFIWKFPGGNRTIPRYANYIIKDIFPHRK